MGLKDKLKEVWKKRKANQQTNTSGNNSGTIPLTWQPPNDIDITKKDEKEQTALHKAVLDNDLELAKHLIKIGSDPNAKDYKGQTPLHKAVKQLNPEMVNLLIKSPVTKLKIKDENGNTPLELCPTKSKSDQKLFLLISDQERRGKPLSNDFELYKYDWGPIQKIKDMLEEPGIHHEKSKENLLQIIKLEEKSKESQISEKTKNQETPEPSKTLGALMVVLENQYHVYRSKKPNPKLAKKQQAATKTSKKLQNPRL